MLIFMLHEKISAFGEPRFFEMNYEAEEGQK
jgi:hypothetical protein